MSGMVRITTALVALLLAGGCAATPEAAPVRIAYSCANGTAIAATYGRDVVTLEDGSRRYRLTRGVSASGARYTGDVAARGVVMTWWTKGQDASWFEAPVWASGSGDDRLVTSCTAR